MIRVALVVLTVLLLGGCATASPEGPGPSATAGPVDEGAVELIGLWRVSDAAGEASETWLRLDGSELMLWRECGFVSGAWSALDGAFVAAVNAANEGCVEDGAVPTVDWLDLAAGYEREGDGWVLRGPDGAAVARLAIDGAPPASPDLADFYREQPGITDEMRARFAAVGVPDGVVPATADDLVGRWVPVETFRTDPHLTVDADGTWRGSDGCNGVHGRWTAPAPGMLLTTGGPMTLMACEGSNEPLAFAAARAAGFDGNELLIYDLSGQPVARLVAG